MKCQKEQLISYLYDDVSAEERTVFERHMRDCADCREELAALRGLRATLSTWKPPQPELAFQIADSDPRPLTTIPRASTPARRAGWRAWWTPASGLAAAAVLVLAAASALAHVEVRYGTDGLSIRTGWNTASAAPAAPVVASAASPASSDQDRVKRIEASNAEIERRIRDLEAAVRTPAASSPVRQVSQVTPARASDAEVLARVRDLLMQSESRQQRELAIRIAQVVRDMDAQRSADLSRIQQGLGRIDAMTTADAAAHRELANYVISSTRQQK
jgi:hypothetical protein